MVLNKDVLDSFQEKSDASNASQGAAAKLGDDANSSLSSSTNLRKFDGALPAEFGQMQLVGGEDRRLAFNSRQQEAAAVEQLRTGVAFVDTVATVTDVVFSLFGAGSNRKDSKVESHEKKADGTTVTKYSDGHKVTQNPNGEKRSEYPDGHYVVHKPDGKGGYREEHGGNVRPEANFVLVKTKDGQYRLDDHLGGMMNVIDGHGPFGERSSFAATVDKLAEEKIKDPEQLAKFRADMLRFEESMVSRDLGAIELMGCYQQIERLLSDTKSQPLSPAERSQLACDLISQLASPSSIEKGAKGTDYGLKTERDTFINRPETAARLLVDMALSGEYQDRYGNFTRLRADQLSPDAEADSSPKKPGARSYASQLFQQALDAKQLEP